MMAKSFFSGRAFRAFQARVAFKPPDALVNFHAIEEVEGQVLFGFEIIEQGAFGDPGFSGNRPGARIIKTFFRKQFQRRC